MKRALPVFLLFLCPTPAAASAPAEVTRYVERHFQNCPGSKVTLEAIPAGGPKNFQAYRATQTSTDERCSDQNFVLVSPATKQVIVGDVMELPQDGLPAITHVRNRIKTRLKREVDVKFEPVTLGDGVRPLIVTLTYPEGKLSYRGYLDASNRFFMSGRRGKLGADPGQELISGLGAEKGARRGNPAAKIQIIEISDLQCPACRSAHEALETLIVKNLDKVSYTRLDFPLFHHHDWALRAALGARAIQRVAPSKYWSYVDFIFDNQESIRASTIDDVVKDFCEMNDVDWAKVKPIYTSAAEQQALVSQVGVMYDMKINSTPTFIVDGQRLFYGNEADYVRKVIEARIKSAPAVKKAAPKKK